MLKWGVLFALLFCSALISGAEVAVFGLSQTDLNAIREQDTKKGQLLLRLLAKPKKLLATILIANNAINIGVVILFSSIDGTHIGHNIPDNKGNRYCINVFLKNIFFLYFFSWFVLLVNLLKNNIN